MPPSQNQTLSHPAVSSSSSSPRSYISPLPQNSSHDVQNSEIKELLDADTYLSFLKSKIAITSTSQKQNS
jgi:hypothetical protein